MELQKENPVWKNLNQPIGKSQLYVLYVDGSGNPILDVDGNQQVVAVPSADGSLLVKIVAGNAVIGKVGMQVGGSDVANGNPVPTTIVGSLANNQTNKAVTANTNILTSNYTSTKYSKSVLQVMTGTAGILSLVVDGVSGTLNSGLALTASAWYEFEISLLSGSTYNLQLSVGATMQEKWQVI